MRSRFLAVVAAGLVLLLMPVTAEAYEQELRRLSGEMAQKISAAQKSTLAVVDFTDLQGDVTALGRFLAEEFSVALAGAGQGFRVIDRTHLTIILREHKLAESGVIDPSTARQLGKIAGVQALITGSLTPFGDSVRIAVKILDTESAALVGSASGNIARTGAIDELLKVIGDPNGGGAPTPSSSDPVVTPPASAIQAQQTIESNEFTFALRGCRVAGGKVTCDLIITNQSADRKLYFYGSSRIFDEYGNEYPAVDAKLGNEKESLGWSISNNLVAGIPTKAEISFSQVGGDSQLLTMFELVCNQFNVQFRNVPLAR